jgi:microcystin-dependent protein
MDGYIGEIRGFAGTFNPYNWMICAGQTLAINQYTPLYAIIGTLYGGDAVSNFKLPDLRGRAPIGFGQGTGLTNRVQGSYVGTEYTQLTVANLPSHNHSAVTSSMTVAGTATGTITPKCFSDEGGLNTAAGNVLGTGSGIYAGAADADADMAPIPASLTLNGTVSGNITVGFTGGSQSMINIQPSLAINWIICVNGIYPQRS